MQNKLTDEPARLAALDRYQILDTAPEIAFDKITTLVQTVLNIGFSAVTLIAHDRQWLKSAASPIPMAPSGPRSASFCTHTIQRHEPMIVPDTLEDSRFVDNPVVIAPPHIRSYIGVPLTSPDGYNVGALCAFDTHPRSFDATQVQILTNFASLVVDELELRLIAKKDFLTGALTRRAFDAALERTFKAFSEQGIQSSVILFDIDHFKRINDELGHAAGDSVLTGVAQFVAEMIPPHAAFGRLGGEEFAILLPNTDGADALAFAESLRRGLTQRRMPGLTERPVTASFGIAATVAGIASPEDWVARADLLMYEAKQSGRNRCRLDQPGS